MPKHSTSARDAALHRLRRLNRWLIAGSVALTAVLADLAANAFPGRTVNASASTAKRQGHSNAGKASTPPVKPPVQAPTATPERATPESPSSGESAPAQESAPSQESAPAQESTPAPEAPPSHESAPAQESGPPASEPAPTHESAPTPAPAPAEQAPPVVSGGS